MAAPFEFEFVEEGQQALEAPGAAAAASDADAPADKDMEAAAQDLDEAETMTVASLSHMVGGVDAYMEPACADSGCCCV